MRGQPYGPRCPKDCPRRSISPNCHNVETCEIWARYVAKKEAAQAARNKARKAERDVEAVEVRRNAKKSAEARRHKCRN